MNNYLDCTEDHPVFIIGKGYISASEIQPGDELLSPTGPRKVKSVELNLPTPEFIYNISTSPNHNFFANDILVHNCDDPIDPKRAVSEAELKTAADFVTNILPSRKVDKSIAVTTLIMQRLHFEDPTGVLLAKSKLLEGAGRIRHICLPARLADNILPVELKEKYIDGLMDPIRLPEIVLREQEMLLGAYSFAGQYSQNPLPLTGGMFQIQYFNQRCKAAPYQASRIRYWDRACLVENTMIHTSTGSKPIRDVRAGEMVLTRNGYKRVKWSGETKKTNRIITVRFTNGSVICGTPEHLVWTENRGWVPLAGLLPIDRLCTTGTLSIRGNLTWDQTRKKKRGSTSTGSYLERVKTDVTWGTSTYTGLCGCTSLGRYPLATTFITKTVIRPITILVIFNWLLLVNIKNYIVNCGKRKSNLNIWTRFGQRRPIGTVSSEVLTKATAQSGSISVFDVVPSFGPKAWVEEEHGIHATVRWNVANLPKKNVAKPGFTVKNKLVPYVTKSLCLQDSDVVAPVSVEHSGDGNTLVAVYDLEVEDCHEFFANDILVHNSTQDGGCYTAGVLMAKDTNGSYFIEHCVHGQWEPDKRNDIMRATALADRARYGPSHEPLIYVEAEGGSSGRDAWKGVARALAGFPIREHRPTGKKEIRAEPWACQLAAKTVWLVEDGTWDINNYIQEHIHFPLGKYKDQVDSSSASFSLLCQQRPTGGLRSYSLSTKKKQALRILICTPEQLANFSTISRCLLIYISDPVAGLVGPVPDKSGTDQPILSEPGPGSTPGTALFSHSLPHVLDTLHLQFLNASPADYQETWLEPVPGFEVLPEKLLLSKTQTKKLWSVTTRHRDPWIEVILLIDENTNRSLSVGYALCDGLQLPRDLTLGWVGKDDWKAKRDDKPVQQWLFDFVKAARSTVV